MILENMQISHYTISILVSSITISLLSLQLVKWSHTIYLRGGVG